MQGNEIAQPQSGGFAGLKAAENFKAFCQNSIEGISEFEIDVDEDAGRVTCTIYLQRILADNIIAKGIAEKLAGVLTGAIEFDVEPEIDSEEHLGMLRWTVVFPIK